MMKRRMNGIVMPAAERSFTAPLPDQLYVDTDFLIAG
jgi:hypothetical protein